jgi:transposase
MRKRKAIHSADFKSRVALEAIKGDLTLNEISSKYKVHSSQIHRWKQQAVASIKDGFNGKQEKRSQNQEQLTEDLYKEIGRQKI